MKAGQQVTCRYEVAGYYSAVGSRPFFTLRPGVTATVVDPAVPKVVLPKRGVPCPPHLDRAPTFVLVEFTSEHTGQLERAALDNCNCIPV